MHGMIENVILYQILRLIEISVATVFLNQRIIEYEDWNQFLHKYLSIGCSLLNKKIKLSNTFYIYICIYF